MLSWDRTQLAYLQHFVKLNKKHLFVMIVEFVTKFTDIFRQIFRANLVILPYHSTFYYCPKTFYRIRMNIPNYVPFTMVYC